MSISRKIPKRDNTTTIATTATTANNTQYGIIEFDDPNFDKKMIELIKEYGVVVIKNVMSIDECSEHMNNIVSDLETISNFKRADIKTWKNENLPQQIRPGMFHEVICNTPTINKLRFDPRIIKIFTSYYSQMKNKTYEDVDMIVSNDGINIKPGNVSPYDNGGDWAHVDQIGLVDDPYKCIQGQMVLSNTNACFRASPKSHLLFKEFLGENASSENYSGFLKFKAEQYFKMQKSVESIGGSWQIKIPANKGDFIIWTSSTVHSATLQSKPEKPTKTDIWNGWRCVVFICYRPREEFTELQLEKKYNAYLRNRVTNHWSTTIFPCGFGWFNARKKNLYTIKIKEYIQDPAKVYELPDMNPILSLEQAVMMGSE